MTAVERLFEIRGCFQLVGEEEEFVDWEGENDEEVWEVGGKNRQEGR